MQKVLVQNDEPSNLRVFVLKIDSKTGEGGGGGHRALAVDVVGEYVRAGHREREVESRVVDAGRVTSRLLKNTRFIGNSEHNCSAPCCMRLYHPRGERGGLGLLRHARLQRAKLAEVEVGIGVEQ